MIRVYILPVQTIDGTEQVLGAEIIHDAILQCTQDPGERKLLMDTTPAEHIALLNLALLVRDPRQDEIDLYNASVVIYEPDPDTIRAQEILATSAAVITMPEIWELLRIIGRRLGYLT